MHRACRHRGIWLPGAAAFGAAACAHAEPPLGYLSSAGAPAHAIVPLTWGVLGVAIAVVLIVCALTLIGTWRRMDRTSDAIASAPHQRDASLWLWIGVGISCVVLAVCLVWTIRVLASTNAPRSPALTIEVTGQQWWWKVRYLDSDASRVLTTANEIHVPTGTTVRVNLIAADVIHSFWVPALGGKTDLIPGQTNVAWLEADRPGRYRGQCSEYCGVQHAHMAFEVVAQTPEDFAQWKNAQLAAATLAPGEDVARGARTFEYRCGACHTVRGTAAGGTTAPDLTHLLSRASIAALTLPNDAAARAAWTMNPQASKPGNHMPVLQLGASELADVNAFLSTLH